MKAAIFAFSMMVFCAATTGCSTGEVKEMTQVETESDEKVISNLILYQYGRELKNWKQQRPKVMQ